MRGRSRAQVYTTVCRQLDTISQRLLAAVEAEQDGKTYDVGGHRAVQIAPSYRHAKDGTALVSAFNVT